MDGGMDGWKEGKDGVKKMVKKMVSTIASDPTYMNVVELTCLLLNRSTSA